jgi:hypothetical protein
MKKLPLCTLLSSAMFAIAGTIVLARIAPRPEPFPLFFPLMWDVVMVAVGAGIVLRCDCARRAGLIWGVFCIFASLAIGATAFGWLWPQDGEPLSRHRLIFMAVTVGFGLLFGIWQLFALNSPSVRSWTDPHAAIDPHSQPHHG